MDAKEIAGLGSELVDFLGGFDDCFGRSGTPRASPTIAGWQRKGHTPFIRHAVLRVPSRTDEPDTAPFNLSVTHPAPAAKDGAPLLLLCVVP